MFDQRKYRAGSATAMNRIMRDDHYHWADECHINGSKRSFIPFEVIA